MLTPPLKPLYFLLNKYGVLECGVKLATLSLMNKTELERTEPNNLVEIEKRLLEIEEEKPRRIHNAQENYSEDLEAIIEEDDIAYLDVEKAILQAKRQFILDRRNSWKARLFWDVIVSIVVATITAYIVSIATG